MDVKMRGNEIRKKAQVTIFIIVALILVAVILLFFLLVKNLELDVLKPSIQNPGEFIEKCAEDSAMNAINLMLLQGGYVSPRNYILYQDNKVGYICYTNKYYFSCIMQEPVYMGFLEKEIHSYMEGKLKDCFFSLKQDYEKRKYIVNEGDLEFEVKLNPRQVEITIEKKFEITKKDEIREYEKYRTKFNSPIYDLGVIAQKIASDEANFCYFDYHEFSINNPNYEVEKKQIENAGNSDVYIITDEITRKEMWIAVKSCSMPGGL